ncbi:hypothetical protein ACF1D3_19215 [Streptomyces sp. NPDC014728]|uniref:hypothetical protein n=1 Tax=unclassified Streptomyces TaxID=2593676 RepID=UPI0036F6B056
MRHGSWTVEARPGHPGRSDATRSAAANTWAKNGRCDQRLDEALGALTAFSNALPVMMAVPT